jgi:hypothetical protein
MKGNRSPYGIRGAICERFGWTYDYLMNGIPWFDVHLMMLDAPFYQYDDKKGDNPTDQPDKSPPQKLNDYFNSFNF